jgi:hypothetical protein
MMSRSEVISLIREALAGVTFRVRRGTTQQWADSTRPLGDGEFGWNKTTKQLYMGNGSALYPNYDVVGGSGGGGSGPTTYASALAGSMFTLNYVSGTGWPSRPSDRSDLVFVWVDWLGESTTLPTDLVADVDWIGQLPL